MFQPEDRICIQGEQPDGFFIIAKGECRCFVKDEYDRKQYARTLRSSEHFGEIALLTNRRRTADIETRNFSTIGKMSNSNFNEMLIMNNELK